MPEVIQYSPRIHDPPINTQLSQYPKSNAWPNMNVRRVAIAVAFLSISSTFVLLTVWIDTALIAAELNGKASYRPFGRMIFVLLCVGVGTIPAAGVGIVLLFGRFKRYGLLLLVISALSYTAVRVSTFIFFESRGVTLGD
jgi:hypothetical protein